MMVMMIIESFLEDLIGGARKIGLMRPIALRDDPQPNCNENSANNFLTVQILAI
jgi:hypothetical protein